MSNFLKTAFLLTLLTLLVAGCGYALGGRRGMSFAVFFACLVDLVVYWSSDRFVLAAHRAQPLAESEAPEVFEIVRKLSEKAKIPMPRLYMLPSASANAFATGCDPAHASIAITYGIVGLLNQEELEGVLAHEMAHILNRDILLSSIVATLAGALSLSASIFRGSFYWGGEYDERDHGHPLALLIVSIIMPVAATLIQLAISRSREYEADQRGAGLCENPLYLASALKRLDLSSKQFPFRDPQPATAHLFIINPLSGKGWARLFSTHPPVDERIARLECDAKFSM